MIKSFMIAWANVNFFFQRDCNLTQIGGLLDSKGYGIATPKGSPWRDQLSLAILELQEKGTIQMLYNKWWKNTGDVCTRQVSKVVIHILHGEQFLWNRIWNLIFGLVLGWLAVLKKEMSRLWATFEGRFSCKKNITKHCCVRSKLHNISFFGSK